MKSFSDFLQSNKIEPSGDLPLVHTTRSFNLRNIMTESAILPQKCDVFHGEEINYFFVGRPSYKYTIDDGADHWMLPSSFVFDIKSMKPKRLYPFDTGGFDKGRMPQFVNEMELSFFEASEISNAANRIIGAFFGSAKDYMAYKGLPESKFNSLFELSPLDAEIYALHKLSQDRKKPAFDDRQFSIEFQTENTIELSGNLKAIVTPIVYLDDKKFVQYFDDLGVEIMTYDIHPVEPKYHFYAIYDKIKSYYQREGMI